MGVGLPAQGSDSTESMAAFMARRRRQTAAVPGARAAAHQTYGDAIRSGLDLSLSQPSDLQNFGARITDSLPFGQDGYGTPTWAKVFTADAAGHPAGAAMADQKK